MGVVVESRVSYGYSLQLLYPSAKVLGNGLCTVPLDRRTGAVEHLDGFLDTVQSGEAHPVETVDQSDLFGMGDLERFGSQIVPLVDPYGGGFETQRCATVEYGDETLTFNVTRSRRMPKFPKWRSSSTMMKSRAIILSRHPSTSMHPMSLNDEMVNS